MAPSPPSRRGCFRRRRLRRRRKWRPSVVCEGDSFLASPPFVVAGSTKRADPCLRQLIAVQVALADGMFMAPEDAYGRLYGDLGATSTEQKGIIIDPAEGREVLLLQTTYHGPAAGFAWVIPVPGEPLDDDVFMASTEFVE
jgi:hypothetical protein